MARVIIDIETDSGSEIRVGEEGRLRGADTPELVYVSQHLGVAVRRALLAMAGLDGYDAAVRVVVELLGVDGRGVG